MVNPDVLSQPQYEPVFEQNIEMPMRDGTILRANVTRPNADPVGALALQKGRGLGGRGWKPEFFARRGYAIGADVQG